MNNYNGKISISRCSDGSIKLELIDEKSSSRLVEIDMTPEVLGLAITGLSYQPCTFNYYENCPVGKTREIKTEIIPLDSNKKPISSIEELKAKYEVDGWSGRWEDLKNFHRWTKDNGVTVTFIRFV